MSLKPENFELRDCQNKIILPYDQINSGVYNVTEVSHPVLMTPTGSISFQGFGVTEAPSNSGTTEKESMSMEFNELEVLRSDAEVSYIKKIQNMEVSREDVYDQILTIFNKRLPQTTFIKLSFRDEDAVVN